MVPQDGLWIEFCLVSVLFFYACFMCRILFSPHPQHGAMQILVHVDVALHRKFYFAHMTE
jgi:hypothetical protein